ncbi:hypothetical protein [Streptomyces hygroscopicus]|uniref:hypothetical protein n=1 Tax=Streptomyces hygroscopicus TaxID=1912 RepID=UPI00082628F0|nr:hypothetical protein [Streptomyces hygroscopicus]
MPDLRLLHLTYAGSGKPTAHVAFNDAITVIYGASDTGKSFIVESIEYMLGGTSLTLIPEAEGYSQILLGLRLPDGNTLTLVRRPGSTTVQAHFADLRDLVTRTPDRNLTAVHTARSTRSLSMFLLGELGLGEVTIRKNEAGGTRALTLPDLTHLSVITETRMVDPLSPVLRSHASSTKTAATSVVKFLLTGDDDPVINTGPNAGQRRVNKGQITLLDQIVLDLTSKLTTQENETQLRQRLARIQTAIDSQSQSLRIITDRHVTAVTRRMQASQDLAALESRLTEVTDLLTRFRLLEQQYRSDLERLAMVSEAGSLLGFFRVGTCVFCGAQPEHQHPGHSARETTQLHEAVQAEAAKTTTLLTDLLPTINDLSSQLDDLRHRRQTLLQQASQLDTEINTAEQQLDPLRAHMDDLLAARSTIERELELHSRINELHERRSKLDGEAATESIRPAEYIPTRVLNTFDTVLRQTLEEWKVPAVDFAEYDQYAADIRAGSRPRAGRGKGVRSVLHSAFTTALARYCIDRNHPHPGFIVLDSPVVTYREPVGEDVDITGHVVDHFYRHLAAFPGQAIIIENGDPPADVLSTVTSYRFTGSEEGRSGFFPTVTAHHGAPGGE